MSVSSITEKNKYLLWVRSGGRCEYEGCNKSLTQDIVTKRNFNQSYIAHIVADVPGGPRGCPTRSFLLKDDISNLMLLCDSHHRLIDKHDIDGHPEAILIEMKKKHEARIDRLTSMAPNMDSHIIIYRANVGTHAPVITYESVRDYLLPTHYPAQSRAIDLGLSNSPLRDKDDSFWKAELLNLETQFNEQLKPRLRKNEINHMSLFAFAPMPLLMKLGTLLNDIQTIEVHQLQRIPKIWNLSNDQAPTEYQVIMPSKPNTAVAALNISLSDKIANERIISVLGDDCSIYTITISRPSNDYLKHKVQLQAFNIAVRQMLKDIKAIHSEHSVLHVFPAMPIATAIEFGRVWMPKADMPLMIYDENTALKGFCKAIEIRNV